MGEHRAVGVSTLVSYRKSLVRLDLQYALTTRGIPNGHVQPSPAVKKPDAPAECVPQLRMKK
jgi:hypothetical protein